MTRTLRLALAGLLLLAPVLGAAQDKPAQPEQPAPAAAPAPSAAQPRRPGQDELGKEAVCPVTGDKFKVNDETLSAEYKGKVYYFCCPACDKPFRENPEKYMEKKEEATQAKAKAI